MESSPMRFLSWPRRALTNSWRCLAEWYSAFSERSPRATAFLISAGSSVVSSYSSCLISSVSFWMTWVGMLICSAMGDVQAFRERVSGA